MKDLILYKASVYITYARHSEWLRHSASNCFHQQWTTGMICAFTLPITNQKSLSRWTDRVRSKIQAGLTIFECYPVFHLPSDLGPRGLDAMRTQSCGVCRPPLPDCRKHYEKLALRQSNLTTWPLSKIFPQQQQSLGDPSHCPFSNRFSLLSCEWHHDICLTIQLLWASNIRSSSSKSTDRQHRVLPQCCTKRYLWTYEWSHIWFQSRVLAPFPRYQRASTPFVTGEKNQWRKNISIISDWARTMPPTLPNFSRCLRSRFSQTFGAPCLWRIWILIELNHSGFSELSSR